MIEMFMYKIHLLKKFWIKDQDIILHMKKETIDGIYKKYPVCNWLTSGPEVTRFSWFPVFISNIDSVSIKL